MKVLGIRYCSVSSRAREMADCLSALGMPQRPLDDLPESAGDAFKGAVFPAGDSWVELWEAGPGMPAGVILQVVVDDADAFAETARQNGLSPEGPMDAHGERIYFLKMPDATQMSFQSSLAGR